MSSRRQNIEITHGAEVAEAFDRFDVRPELNAMRRLGHNGLVVGRMEAAREFDGEDSVVSIPVLDTSKGLGVIRFSSESDLEFLRGESHPDDQDYSESVLRERIVPLNECQPYEKDLAGREAKDLIGRLKNRFRIA